MRALIVGQAPGARKGRPFDGPGSGARLTTLMGSDHREFFDAVNLVRRYPGKSGKGDAFPLDEARRAARRIDLSSRPFVLLAGKSVARAFGVRAEFLEWFELRGTRTAIVPHPSGVSRWWNDASNMKRARRFMRRLAKR